MPPGSDSSIRRTAKQRRAGIRKVDLAALTAVGKAQMREDDPPPSPALASHGRVSVTVAPEQAGERLDRFLAAALPALSRSRLQALIKGGQVAAGGQVLHNAGLKVKAGDAVEVDIPPARPAEPAAEAIALTVVHEDDDLIVIDKPAGLVVHPAAGHSDGTLVNALIAHCGPSLSGIGGVMRPGIVHRLDKDTSGLLVVAKNDAAHRGLSDQFQAHGRDGRLHRSYLAFVWGVPLRPTGTISAPLGRSTQNRLKIAVRTGDDGREAITHYELLETFPGSDGKPVASLLRCRLETGRTHQIRVHLAHVGHPLLGDSTYGSSHATRRARLNERTRERLDSLERQALHAAELGFEHPLTGRALHFESELPSMLQELHVALQKRQ